MTNKHEQPKLYPLWFIQLMQEVCDMRDAQRRYFSNGNNYRLKIAKYKEAVVDEYLKKFVAEGIIAHKQDQQSAESQQKLFK